MIVKQNSPDNDDSSVFEIFSRLNSGGMNLTPQEIRLSLYHSEFYNELMELNLRPLWRRVLGTNNPDLHQKDVEILLRMFAMLVDHSEYAPSMMKFLNQFSKKCQKNSKDQNAYLRELFDSFLQSTSKLPANAFLSKKTQRFSIALIEAVFTASALEAFNDRRMISGIISASDIQKLAEDQLFQDAATKASTTKANVEVRLKRGRDFIASL